MKNYEVSEKIAAYIAGDLDEQDYNKVTELIATNEAWKEELMKQQQLESIIESSNDSIPPIRLKDDFERMLSMEINTIKQDSKNSFWNGQKFWLQIAASITILIVGYFIGMNVQDDTHEDELTTLRKEIAETKQLVINSLNNTSASTRLNAVNTTSRLSELDQDIMLALFNTLDTDENMNVRIAALEALSQYADQEIIRTKLIESLAQQDQPTVQIVLINLLVKLNDKRAIDPLKEMMKDENTIDAVKDEASFGVFKLS